MHETILILIILVPCMYSCQFPSFFLYLKCTYVPFSALSWCHLFPLEVSSFFLFLISLTFPSPNSNGILCYKNNMEGPQFMKSSIMCCCYATDYYLVCIPARHMTNVERCNYLQNLSFTVHISMNSGEQVSSVFLQRFKSNGAQLKASFACP